MVVTCNISHNERCKVFGMCHVAATWERLNHLPIAGGEKKRNEILQMSVLDAELSILDEIDSGLDIDALKDVASAVNGLKNPETATLMVTHYKVCEAVPVLFFAHMQGRSCHLCGILQLFVLGKYGMLRAGNYALR